jgi:uncharacterized surface anchored protein
MQPGSAEPPESTPRNGVEPTELPRRPTGPRSVVELRGRIRGHRDTVLSGATLTLMDPRGVAAAHTASGSGGEFQLQVRGPGDYLLVASSAGHEPLATYLAVGESGADAEVRLRGAVGLAGQITDADGEPLPGATLTLVDADGLVIAAVRSGRDGRYALDDLVGGVYTLAVTGPSRPAVAVRVDLPATGRAERDVALLPGAKVFGTARDEHWRPLAGIRVALLDSHGAVVVEAITDRDGGYAFADLREGLYTVVATGYPPVTATLQVEPGQQHEYDVALHH